METLQIMAVIAVSAGFMLLIWKLKALLYKSLQKPKNGAYRVSGIKTPAELENTVRSLVWQRAREGQLVDITINCAGFDEEMLRMARLFARDHEYIILE